MPTLSQALNADAREGHAIVVRLADVSTEAYAQAVLDALDVLGGVATNDELVDQVADDWRLSQVDRTRPHGVGSVTEFYYRLAWARTRLRLDGLICNVGRGRWAIIANGTVAPDGSADRRERAATPEMLMEVSTPDANVGITGPEMSTALRMIARTDPENSSTVDLLAAWASLHAELARRFGNSNIVGCYGELLVAAALNGTVRPNSAAGGDVLLPDGRLVEVKTRAVSGAGRHTSGIFKWDKAAGGWPFALAAFVQLEESTLRPVRAFMVEATQLGEPKLFGSKSPVLGQQVYANRRYNGEVNLLPKVAAVNPSRLPDSARAGHRPRRRPPSATL